MTLLEERFNQARTKAKPPALSRRIGEKSRARVWHEENVAKARRHSGLTYVEDDLTVGVAELLLSLNPDNRGLKRVRINQIKADLAAGAFDELNGDSLKISREGLLNDGQNRCVAVIESGIPFHTTFVFGCKRESRKTNDQVTPKVTRDFLEMDGHVNAGDLSAVGGLLWQYETKDYIKDGPNFRPTPAQVQKALSENPRVADSIASLPKGPPPAVASASVLAFVHYILSRRNERAAKVFINHLVKGTMIDTGDPIWLVRARLLKPGIRLTRGERIELIFQAWNLWRRGETQYRYVISGRMPEIAD